MQDDATEQEWYQKPSLGQDSLNFLTNLFATLCGQHETYPPRGQKNKKLDNAMAAD